jgi:hypothetical protein
VFIGFIVRVLHLLVRANAAVSALNRSLAHRIRIQKPHRDDAIDLIVTLLPGSAQALMAQTNPVRRAKTVAHRAARVMKRKAKPPRTSACNPSGC